ncbi:MAG: IS3 family transposase [Bacillus sp. (in: Bacteria)]|nr:IS3 family transposase [Bacillus sp. (in: firmicutes)]
MKRNFETTSTNEKWVTDVTEIPIANKKLYVSALMDLHNNHILGYQYSESHDVQLVEDTLLSSLENVKLKTGVILHSDRGVNYRSNGWKKLIDGNPLITPSMSRKANAIDNACIECFFSYLKTEIHELKTENNIEMIKSHIDTYMYYYNNKRIQGVLDYLTPVQYAQAS